MTNNNYTNFEILPNGNLKITLTQDGKIELNRIQTEYAEDWIDYETLWNILEHQLCNGWDWLRPEQVGALTDSPILTNDVTYNDNGEVEKIGQIWWYPNYMIDNLTEVLYNNGYIIFEKGE
jgi:hypothetical protein